MNDIVAQEPVEIFRPSAAIDPQRLEYLWTLAERIAQSTIVPESLRMEGNANNKKDLPRETVIANVFAVVEQADRWNQSPFALLACAAIVHGRLGFEGKVISAVLKSRYGIDLDYQWDGEGENRRITITGYKPGSDKPLTVIGTVKEWKTSGNGSPWRASTYDKMLAYRGAREWSRLHEPSAILGVLGDDEILAIGMERQAQLARDVTPSLTDRFGGSRRDGFNPANVRQITGSGQVPMEIIDRETGEISEVKREATAKQTSPARKGEEPLASVKPASTDAGRGGQATEVGSRPEDSSPSVPPNGDEKAGKREPPAERLSADLFRKYASALARMQSEDHVRRADGEFWKSNGPVPAKGSPDYILGAGIFGKQIARAKGDIPAEGLLDEIHADIEASFAGKEEL